MKFNEGNKNENVMLINDSRVKNTNTLTTHSAVETYCSHRIPLLFLLYLSFKSLSLRVSSQSHPLSLSYKSLSQSIIRESSIDYSHSYLRASSESVTEYHVFTVDSCHPTAIISIIVFIY